jgi:major membrane immunogen (membrane-anchored lipoprotein)
MKKLKTISLIITIIIGLIACGSDDKSNSTSSKDKEVAYYGNKSNSPFVGESGILSSTYKDKNLYFLLTDCANSDSISGFTDFYIYKDGTASTSYYNRDSSYNEDFCNITKIYVKTTNLSKDYEDVNGTYINRYEFYSNNYSATIITDYLGNEVVATQGVDDSTIKLNTLKALGSYIKADINWYNSITAQEYNKTVNVNYIAEEISFTDAGLN